MTEQHEDGPIHIFYYIGILESVQHSLLSLFLLGDIKLRTTPGRIIQISYWFVGIFLLASYLSTMVAILSKN